MIEKWSSGGLILDFYDDIYLSGVRDNSELLKQASNMEVLSIDQLRQLKDEDFGLIVLGSPKLRKYPLHDEAHVLMAKEYFEKNSSKLTPPMRKTAAYYISRACMVYGIDGLEDLTKIAGTEASTNYVDTEAPYHEDITWAQIRIPTMPDSSFALVKTSEDKTVRMYPIEDEGYLKQGIAHFADNYTKLDPIERVKIAQAMVSKAKELGSDTDLSEVEKYATTQDNPNFDFYISRRKELLNTDTESVETLEGLIEKRADYNGFAFGRALEVFDEATGLHNFWDVAIPDPYQTCYSIDTETITPYGLTKTAGLHEDKIMKLADSDNLGDVFGPSTVEEFRKDPVTIYNSLPAPTQQLLMSLNDARE